MNTNDDRPTPTESKQAYIAAIGCACKSCGKPIAFLPTRTGRRIPVDLDHLTQTEVYDPSIHRAHFITCPDREGWLRHRRLARRRESRP